MGMVEGVEFFERLKELILNGSVFITPRAGALHSEVESWKVVYSIVTLRDGLKFLKTFKLLNLTESDVT